LAEIPNFVSNGYHVTFWVTDSCKSTIIDSFAWSCVKLGAINYEWKKAGEFWWSLQTKMNNGGDENEKYIINRI